MDTKAPLMCSKFGEIVPNSSQTNGEWGAWLRIATGGGSCERGRQWTFSFLKRWSYSSP